MAIKRGDSLDHCDNDAEFHTTNLPRDCMHVQGNERTRRILSHPVLECGAMASCSESDTSQSFSNQVSRHLLKRQWGKKQRRRQMQGISGPWSLERPHVECAGKSDALQRPKARESKHLPSPKNLLLLIDDSVAIQPTRIIEGKAFSLISFQHHKLVNMVL